MIYVRRDPALIPEKVLKVAERAQATLETLPPDERVAFIKKKSHVWTGFKRYLSKMSYGKCWYSESPDPQSFFDVDHFRPKSEAQRDEGVPKDSGYPWLAFDWDNFRYSAGRSNRYSTDEKAEEVVGKGSWFPLCHGSPCASWDNRTLTAERPVLLDPTDVDDMGLVKIGSAGSVEPSGFCVGSNRERVAKSVKYYGLDLPALKEARLQVMREVQEMLDVLLQTVEAANAVPPAADLLPVPRQAYLITAKTMPNSPYALAARSRLIELGAPELIARPENYPAP